MQVVTLAHGQPQYADLLDEIRADTDLVRLMWEHAEACPSELDVPGTRWSVAVVDGVPAAWCAARVQDDILLCHSSYERPDYRGRGLYEAAYRRRHEDVVEMSGLPAVTYLFAQPLALHEADGWCRTGREGSGELDGHWWLELRRPA
jgi:hypothetical protein